MITLDRCPSAANDTETEKYVPAGDLNRRCFIGHAGVVIALIGCGLLPDSAAALPDDGVFKLSRMSDVLERLGGIPTDHDEITITVPDLSENGANVRVSVASSLVDVQDIYVLAESNPFPFAAAFSIPVGTDASVAVNLKLAQSSEVIGVVRARDKLYWTSKYTQVTVGGCA
jgi:sulfur-oxidizing protein SoxY